MTPVASFNVRARRVVTAPGFRAAGSLRATSDGVPCEILTRTVSAAEPD